MNIRTVFARGALFGAALLTVATLMDISGAPAAYAVTGCTQITPSFSNMTAAYINPTTLPANVDATGCDIGVYFGPEHYGAVESVHISGATAFGIVVDSAVVDITHSNITNIPGATGSDEGECESDCEGDSTTMIPTDNGEEKAYIGDKHGTGILVVGEGARAVIANNSISGYGRRGISVSGFGAWASVKNNYIEGLGAGNAQHTMGQSGIWIANGRQASVSGNIIVNNEIIGSGPASNAIMVAGGSYHNNQPYYTTDIKISGNTLRNNATGVLLSNLKLDGSAPLNPTRNIVAGNYIANTGNVSALAEEKNKPTAGILVAGGNGDHITGNTISGYANAITISKVSQGLILVKGNTIIG